MPAELRCPQCGTEVAADDFQCARCELLLNAEVEEEVVTEPSLVRALLGPTQRRPTGEIPLSPERAPVPPAALGDEEDEVATAEYESVVGPQLVPRIVAGLDVAGKLDGFEAYIASFIDGAQGPRAIAIVARVAEVEVQAVLRNLREREVIEIVARPIAVPRAGPAALHAASSTDRSQTRRTFAAPPPRRPPTLAPSPEPARQAEPMAAPPRRFVPLDAPTGPTEPQDREESVLQRAVSLERSGQIDGAIHVLKRGIARVKNPAPLYNRLALILLHQRRDHRQAEELLRKALEVAPDHPVYQQNLYKVLALAASGTRPERKGSGLLDRLIRRK